MTRPANRPPGRTQKSPRVAEGYGCASPPEKVAAEDFVSLAEIVRARGRIGEVAAAILTDFPDRLTKLRGVFLLDAAGRRRAARVKRCWLSPSRGGQAVFHFEGVNSIGDAQKLVGYQVQVPLAERVPLPTGRYYISDLIGCEVVEAIEEKDVPDMKEVQEVNDSFASFTSSTSFTSIGVIRDVYLESGTPLLVVGTPAGELLIPLADEICTRIDTDARRIEVRLPPGLRDLNR